MAPSPRFSGGGETSIGPGRPSYTPVVLVGAAPRRDSCSATASIRPAAPAAHQGGPPATSCRLLCGANVVLVSFETRPPFYERVCPDGQSGLVFSHSSIQAAQRSASASGCWLGCSVPFAHHFAKRVTRCASASSPIAWATRLLGLTGRSNTPTSAPAVSASNTIDALSGVTHTLPLFASCSGSQPGGVIVWGTTSRLGAAGSCARKSAGVRREVVSVHCMSGVRARMLLICTCTASLSHSKCGE